MLSTEFTFNLTEPILPGKVTIGYFDGIHPSIVAVTRADKIFVHNPHNRSVYDPDNVMIDNNIEDGTTSTGTPTTKTSGQFIVGNSGNDLNFLNINQTITCIGAGPISSTTK
ncbi:hypothetical protein RDWZM_004666 [Blomia tropicalis]|uniref:Ciliary BBSome complex subunit 2 N-terminal domain-containing protein n=1 Tax=Blomia tropicalis TaxID=40697 RepID=A0A9Q0M4N9_BLOTA|nr:hypothetical protein RDWZM_004666 [Blomia tropicalis]